MASVCYRFRSCFLNVISPLNNLFMYKRTTTSDKKVIADLSSFTKGQEKLVLDQINTKSQPELSNMKGIGNIRGQAIIDCRAKNGPLTSLAELAQIKGFGKGFFANLLKMNCIFPVMGAHGKLANLLTTEQKQNISDVVSIDIGINNAAFVHIDREKNVLDWQRVPISVPKPYNPSTCKEIVQNFVTTLPEADVYLIELQSHRASRTDPVMFPFVLHLRVVEAMLHCLLKHKLVFDLNPVITAKYFGLPVGVRKKRVAVDLTRFMLRKIENIALLEKSPEQFFEKATRQEGSKETVSTILAASDFMIEKYPHHKWFARFPQHLVEYFENERKKDDLSDCFLQALAFIDLAL